MFGKKPESIKLEENAVSCLISSETRIDGNITFTGGLRVDGVINGNVVSPEGQHGTLILSENARVDGQVVVTDAIINGTVNGSITAYGGLQLEDSAKIEGDISYKMLEMFPGAVVCGKLVHLSEASVPQSEPFSEE